MYGEDVDDAVNFVTDPNVSTRTRTTASTVVSQADIADGWYGIDATAIVQEVVGRPGWASGNALAIVMLPPVPGVATHAHFHSVDTNPTFAAKIQISYTPPLNLVLGEHGSGQVADQFDGSSAQNDAGLIRFRLQNTAATAITADQLVIQLSSVSGIVDGDLSDLRVHDGTVDVSTGGVPSIAGATGSVTFSGDFTVPASSTRDYTVFADVANLVDGDTVTVGVSTSDVTLLAGSMLGSSPASPTHLAEPTVSLADHGSGQITDQFDGSSAHDDASLFRFRLVNNTPAIVTVDQVILPLSSVAGLVTGDLSDLRINDGSSDVTTGGVPAIAGATGTITFGGDFALPAGATVDYTVIGDAASLVNGDTLTVALGTANVALAAGQMGGVSATGVAHTAENTVLLGAHGAGQLGDQFDGTITENDVGLFRFRLVNNSGTAATVDQVVFPLNTISGIVTGDLSDLRISDGTDVSVGGVPSIAGATGTVTFSNDFVIGAGATKDYTLVADVASLASGDTVTVTLGAVNVTLISGSLGGSAPANATHTADDTVTLGEHSSGQVTDQLDASTPQTNVSLFRFQLVNNGGAAVTVDEVVLQLTGVIGIVAGDATNLRIHDGTSDVSTGGTPAILGATGTLTFGADFVVSAGSTEDYTVFGDLANLDTADALTLGLATGDVTLAAGNVGGVSPTSATHVTNAPRLDLEITDTNDDAWEQVSTSEDTTHITDTNIQISAYPNTTQRRNGGFRFQNVTLPAAASINSASLKLYMPGQADYRAASFRATVYGHDVKSSPNFATIGDMDGLDNTVMRTERDHRLHHRRAELGGQRRGLEVDRRDGHRPGDGGPSRLGAGRPDHLPDRGRHQRTVGLGRPHRGLLRPGHQPCPAPDRLRQRRSPGDAPLAPDPGQVDEQGDRGRPAALPIPDRERLRQRHHPRRDRLPAVVGVGGRDERPHQPSTHGRHQRPGDRRGGHQRVGGDDHGLAEPHHGDGQDPALDAARRCHEPRPRRHHDHLPGHRRRDRAAGPGGASPAAAHRRDPHIRRALRAPGLQRGRREGRRVQHQRVRGLGRPGRRGRHRPLRLQR